MRIDFLITELNVGGAEKTLTELAIGMQARRHQVRVLSIGSEPSAARHRLVDRLGEQKIRVEFGGFDHSVQLISAARWLARQLRTDRPELCQTFLFHANCLGAAVGRRSGVDVLVGGLRVAESNRIRSAVERRAVRRMNHLVCVSRKVLEFATDQLSADPEICSVIPNGVDFASDRLGGRFDWSNLGWPPDSKVALFVGRLHPQKGLELIQQQFATLFEGRPDRRLLLIGEGPLGEPLSRWAQGIGEDRVRMLPFQTDVAPFLNAASMLILPSHYEGMPNVVLEAMAAGLPVVCSRVEGSDELLCDGAADSGQTRPDRSQTQGFPPGDGHAMSRLAEAFFRDPQRCQQIGQANQRHVERHFSNHQMVDRYETLYRSLSRQRG